MCQLWALHVVIKRQFFNIHEFILHMYIIAQTDLQFCKNKQKSYRNTTSGFDFCELNHRQHSYDVIKVFNMAAVEVTNQLPVPV